MMAAMDGASWAEATGVPGMGVAIPYFELFSRLAASSEFVEDFGRAPKLFSQPCEGIAGSFTLKDLEQAVDSDFLDAGRGVSGKGGWKMAPVSQPRGSSFEEAKMRYCDVAASLSGGTVVFNSAGAYIPVLRFAITSLHALSVALATTHSSPTRHACRSSAPSVLRRSTPSSCLTASTCIALEWAPSPPPRLTQINRTCSCSNPAAGSTGACTSRQLRCARPRARPLPLSPDAEALRCRRCGLRATR